MPSAYVPTMRIFTYTIGASPTRSPILVLKIDGVIYGEVYSYSTSNYTVRLSPVYDRNTRIVSLVAIVYTYGSSFPGLTLNGVEIISIG